MTEAIAIASVIVQSVPVPSLCERQASATDKPGTVKAVVTRVKPASGDGGVSA